MEKIIYSEGVVDFLNDLVGILFEKEYFGFMDSSKEYVDRITNDIESLIDVKRHRKTPKRLQRHGSYYAAFKGSKRTTWYVFFDKYDGHYYIEFITNNHSAKASFIRGL